MSLLYVDTGGSALNSGSSDNNTADLSGTLAVQAGAVITLSGPAPDLSGVSISGATQAFINLVGATNANRTVFPIIAVDNTLKTVTVDATVTGTLVGWKIGGRYLWPSGGTVDTIAGAIGLGLAQDILQYNNSPASRTGTYLTARNAGTVALGRVLVRGKSGVRPVLQITNTTIVLTLGQNFWGIENLELQQNGASGNVVSASGTSFVAKNIKISDGGANGFNCSAQGAWVIMCELSGVSGSAVAATSTEYLIYGNYIHDTTPGAASDGVNVSSATPRGAIISNVVETNSGKGIVQSAAISANVVAPIIIIGNTAAYNADSGYEFTDTDAIVFLVNNIGLDNGTTGTSFNVEQGGGAGAFENFSFHGYNCFSIAGALGGGNVTRFTIDATETTSNPLFTNAAAGDYSLQSGSPCKATGFPGQLLGGNLGYMDMGAIQRQEAGTGGVIGSRIRLGM